MTLLTDSQIKVLALNQNMIDPFVHMLKTTSAKGYKLISYGLSSAGYDIRLSPCDFKVFKHIPGQIVDPKNFNPKHLEDSILHNDKNGDYFILPGNSYGLGVAIEFLTIPDNIMVTCIGKSTYARVGVIANVTPAEPGWKGHLTLEFSNSSNADCKVYANEGVVQLLFHQLTESCMVSYSSRNGKYQNQTQVITLPKV